MKSSKKPSKAGLVFLILFLIAALGCGGFFGYKFYRYIGAEKAMTAGKYEQAHDMFASLSGFLDANIRQADPYYRMGYDKLDAGEYDAAAEGFQKAADIISGMPEEYFGKDHIAASWSQKKKAMDAEYGLALVSLEKGEYADAVERLESLNENRYDVSEELLKDTRYRLAKRLIDEKHYFSAKKQLEMIPGYFDTDELLADETLNEAVSAFERVCQDGEVPFGHFEQDGDFDNGAEDIWWDIMETDGTVVTMISDDILAVRAYSLDGSATWADSELRVWLNGDFLQSAFTEEERTMILPTEIEISEGYSSIVPETSTTDEVYLMGVDQALERYKSRLESVAFASDYVKEQLSAADRKNPEWWVRGAANLRDDDLFVVVLPFPDKYNGNTDRTANFADPRNQTKGVRPVIRIDLEAYMSTLWS